MSKNVMQIERIRVSNEYGSL